DVTWLTCPETDGEFERQKKEKLPQTKADIARCWAKYCLNVIRREDFEDEEDEENNEENKEDLESKNEEENRDKGSCTSEPADEKGDEKNPLRFESLEVTSYEQSVPDKVVSGFEEAREIFKQGQRWLTQAKEYYELDGHVSDYVQIEQDVSQLYKELAKLETDKERKCKMHKRRVDVLCAVLADSMKQKQVLPETYDDDIVRPALVSHFCVARLHGKIICSETRTKVDNLQKSLELYKYVVNYCDSHPGLPVAVFKDELEISREMTGLLPLKMAKIMAQSS
ncbi:predicted protein, partial [Nematostella vectensis]